MGVSSERVQADTPPAVASREQYWLPITLLGARIWQEFVEILQAATAGDGSGLQVAHAPLDEYPLPGRFTLLHAAVQYSMLAAAFLSGRS